MDTKGLEETNPTPFLLKLWKLVNDIKTDELIHWDAAGKIICIEHQTYFAKTVLPSYYKHNCMSSFIRQLNLYGFRKIPNENNHHLRAQCHEQHQLHQHQQFDNAEFVHKYFQKGKKHLLCFIQRQKLMKKRVAAAAAAAAAAKASAKAFTLNYCSENNKNTNNKKLPMHNKNATATTTTLKNRDDYFIKRKLIPSKNEINKLNKSLNVIENNLTVIAHDHLDITTEIENLKDVQFKQIKTIDGIFQFLRNVFHQTPPTTPSTSPSSSPQPQYAANDNQREQEQNQEYLDNITTEQLKQQYHLINSLSKNSNNNSATSMEVTNSLVNLLHEYNSDDDENYNENDISDIEFQEQQYNKLINIKSPVIRNSSIAIINKINNNTNFISSNHNVIDINKNITENISDANVNDINDINEGDDNNSNNNEKDNNYVNANGEDNECLVSCARTQNLYDTQILENIKIEPSEIIEFISYNDMDYIEQIYNDDSNDDNNNNNIINNFNFNNNDNDNNNDNNNNNNNNNNCDNNIDIENDEEQSTNRNQFSFELSYDILSPLSSPLIFDTHFISPEDTLIKKETIHY